MKKKIFVPRKVSNPRLAILDKITFSNGSKLKLIDDIDDEDDYTGFEDCDGDLDFYAQYVDPNIGNK